MALAADKPRILDGTRRALRLPSPSSPSSLKPHAQTVPSFLKARECPIPAAIAAMSESPFTWLAEELWFLVPSPSWPFQLFPQAQTVPSPFRATQ